MVLTTDAPLTSARLAVLPLIRLEPTTVVGSLVVVKPLVPEVRLAVPLTKDNVLLPPVAVTDVPALLLPMVFVELMVVTPMLLVDA